MAVESETVNATLTNTIVSFVDSPSAPWVMIGDAVESASSPSPSPISIDGSNGVGCPNTTSSCSGTLTTTHSNDVVIAYVTESLDLQTSCTFSISDTNGLSWTARSGIEFNGDHRWQMQEFWARSSSALSSDSITESILGCGNNYNNLMVFGVAGASSATPFDPNTALPGMTNGFSGSTTVPVSTSNARDLIFSAVVHGNITTLPTAEPGFTIITPPGTNAVEFETTNSTVSNMAVTFGDHSSGQWVSIGDAVQSGAAASGPSTDGSSWRGCSHNTNSCSTYLSTSHANDIIMVDTFEGLDLQTTCTFSVKDTMGLSWQLRASVSGRNDSSTGGNRDQVAEFWARTSNLLVSDNITEAISGCASTQYGGEYNGLQAFGVSGANFNTPFDPNISVPGAFSGYSITPSGMISTSTPGDLVLGAAEQTHNTISNGPGFFAVPNSTSLDNIVEYKQTTSTVSNLPVTWADNTTWWWEVITDAVQPASAITIPPSFNINTNNLITLTAGNTATELVTVSGIGNFTGTVNLTTAVIPSFANSPTLKLNSSQVNVPTGSFGSTFLAVFTNLNTTAGGYNFTISGSAVFGGKTIQHTFFGNIIVQAPPQPDFFINASPTLLTVFAGASTTSSIFIFPVQFATNSFTVALSTQLPAVQGLTATLNPPSVTLSQNSGSGFSTLTVNTLSATAAGNYTFTLIGKSGTISHAVLYSLQVRPPPKLMLSPTSGPIGTKVVVFGSGFLSQFGLTEILVSFDDQFVGPAFTSTGGFNFTFNVPVAQATGHTVKATESIFTGTGTVILTASAPFQVTIPPVLSTALTVGTIYFPGDTAVSMIQVTSSGVPASSTALQLTVTLTRPDNSKVVLNITSLGSGLFRSSYALSTTAMIGTYSIQAVAHLTGATDGSSLGSFEVKLPWLSSQAKAAITTGGIATVGALGVALVSWRMGSFRRPKKTI